MQRNSFKMKNSRINRIKKSKKRSVAIIIIAIIICLFLIYRFTFFTKTESTNQVISVSFNEYNSGRVFEDKVEVFEDENGKYIVLPEKVSGIYAQRYIENSKQEENSTLENTVSINQNENITNENQNNENITNSVNSNTNTITNTVVENTSTSEKATNTSNTNTVAEETTNTTTENNDSTNTTLEQVSTEKDESTAISDSLFDKAVKVTEKEPAKAENPIDIDNHEGEASSSNKGNEDVNNEDIKNEDAKSGDSKTEENKNTEQNSNENTVDTEKNQGTVNPSEGEKEPQTEQNKPSKNQTAPEKQEQTKPSEEISSKDDENKENDENENSENRVVEEESGLLLKTSELDINSHSPGEKYYITDENNINLEVEFQSVEINGLKLYKQDLSSEDDYAEIKVTGFIPLGDYIEAVKEDEAKYEELKADVEGIENSEVILAYDIKLTDGTNYYQPKDYYQSVKVAITAKENVKDKFTESFIQVIHIVEKNKEDENEIIFEKLAIAGKTEDSVEVVAEEFSTYLVTALTSTVTEDQVYVYDYESDKNYFTGKNYTNELTGETTKSFPETDLAQVKVNYYSYDYSEELETEKPVTLTPTFSEANYETEGNGNRERFFPITINISTSLENAVDPTKPYSLSFNIQNSVLEQFSLQDSISYRNTRLNMTQNEGKIIIEGDNLNNWTKTDIKNYSLTFYLAFNTNADGTNAIERISNSLSGFEFTGVQRKVAGFVSNTERQTLFTYDKCVYAPGGNLTLELIDNPYMDRPAGYGFNGWKTNEANYNISTNQYTFEQTVSVSLNNIRNESGEYVINLYPDWSEANIVFLDLSNGNDNTNTGLDIDYPLRNWTTATTLLTRNVKHATAASDRELNILVLKNGTLTTSNQINIGNAGVAYTLTSLYDGNLNNATVHISTGTNTLSHDLQLDFLRLYCNTTYHHDGGTNDINYRLVGNTYNLRIGRGIIENNNYTTFAQVQGGPNGTTRSQYKLVIESGKYNNIQLGRASGTNEYTSCGTLVLGSDIDRANNNNTNLNVYNRTASRTSGQNIHGINDGIRYLGYEIKPENGITHFMIIKSGTLGKEYFEDNGNESAYSGIYIGGHGSSADDFGDRYLIVEGADIANIIGGLQIQSGTVVKTCIFVKGGIIQNIVGGAGVTQTYGDRIVQVTDGEIAYSISGGSNGYLANSTSHQSGNNGRLVGSTFVYVGGNAVVGTTGINNTLYDVSAGCVLGAGNGKNGFPYSGAVTSSHVVVDGNADIKHHVYAAGNFGKVEGEEAGDGEMANKDYAITTGLTSGNAFTNQTGNDMSNTPFSDPRELSESSQWTFEDADRDGYYYIKNKATDRYLTITASGRNNATVSIGTTRTSLRVTRSGEGYTISYQGWRYTGYLRFYNGSWSATTTATTVYLIDIASLDKSLDEKPICIIDILGGTVEHDVYGGGNNNGVDGSIGINMKNGTVDGTIYGGANTSGIILSDAKISVTGGTIGVNAENNDALFGGGKGEETIIANNVTITAFDKDNDIDIEGSMYGGSALGSVEGETTLNVEDHFSDDKTITINGDIYGGGRGDTRTAAVNEKNVTVTVDGGDFPNTKAFGGCNINGEINSDVLVKIGENYKTYISEVYGGGNQAYITENTTSDIVNLYKNATVDNAFNGGNEAGIRGSNTREINAIGATVTEALYGGSNTSGDLSLTNVNCSELANVKTVYGGGYGQQATVSNLATVNIENSIIETVYGGGNAGPINGNTDVNITTSQINGSAFGGGKGETAVVSGNTDIEVTDVSAEKTIGDGVTAGFVGSVYGGGDAGEVRQNTKVSITSSEIGESVYGGGNQADVDGNTSVNTEATVTNNVFGGGKQGAVQRATAVSVMASIIKDSVYGGGDEGNVTGYTNVTVSNEIWDKQGDKPKVYEAVFGGGRSADVGGTIVSILSDALVPNVYGGGDQGEVDENTQVTVKDSTIEENVYGGGNGAEIGTEGRNPGSTGGNTEVIVNTSKIYRVFGGGRGITASVQGDTRVDLNEGAEIADDVYGGGDNGFVNGSTNVELTSPTINGNVYAAGNGKNAIVYGNSNVYSEEKTYIKNNLYGGGNAAETGHTDEKIAHTTVDIAGIIIDGNIYGGANSSSINGSTYINIGNEAINTYHGEDKNYIQGEIKIAGTVYGGGQSMNVNSDVWDDTAISVTDKIYINIYGDGYDTTATNALTIGGSIFGSGNASNATQDGFVNIMNFGTESNRKKLVSIQRCTDVVINNSVLMLAGIKDSTSNYKETPFTFNKIADLKLQNNSILYLRNGANRLSKYESLNADGTYATVTINPDYTVNASSDNRIYMANGVNLNVCYGDPQKQEVGPVKGMTFFGIYKSAPAGSSDPDGIYKGIYDQSYVTGGQITDWNSREYLRTYVYGEHTKNPEQDIEKDGFYTNYEALDEGYDYGNISSSNYSAKSYTAYIIPTPTGDYTYYYWYAGPDQDTYIYDIELVASKFSTLGSVELPFSDMNFPDATLTMNGIDTSGLDTNINLVSKNEIENINTESDANRTFGLSMKSGNTGWSLPGTTNFYMQGYDGSERYQFENAQTTPSLSFFLYHSNNITEDQDLGRYTITMNVTYWRDALNRGTALVIINCQLFTRVYEGIGYNTAITPGMQYDLFTGTLTNITTKSSFSAYFEIGEQDFFSSLEKTITDAGYELKDNYYDEAYRVISTGIYTFPEDTTITMIDRYDKNNPEYYYYTVTADDEANDKREFKLSEFLAMGSTNEKYSEAEMRKKYYLSDLNYEYENFIFIVNFEGADFGTHADGEKITPDGCYFEMYLRYDLDVYGEEGQLDLAKIINDQLYTTRYDIYESSSTIDIDASLSRDKIYLGRDETLTANTIYNANKGSTVFDTRYFDKKLGVKLTFFVKDENGDYVQLTGGSLLGTAFELDGHYYYPRADGVTRIKLAELVSNVSSNISIDTTNSVLETGDYQILVESFGSADGIYFGVEASASDTVNVRIINDIYGLKSSFKSEKEYIVDYQTGHTLNDEGYISESDEDNKLEVNLDYQSGLTNPFITVSLYRRNYNTAEDESINPYDTNYTLVDLKDYVTNELEAPQEIVSSYDEGNQEVVDFINSLKKFDREYIALRTDEINEKAQDMTTVTFDNLSYELKTKLTTGTYKLVFKLYDVNDTTAQREVKDEEGTITNVENYNIKQYEEIGDAFSYVIIK